MDDDAPDPAPVSAPPRRKPQGAGKADRRAEALKANLARRKAQARARAADGQTGEEQEQP